jgi:energy-coupling factor transporter ATP-binding protein EcfA2
MDRPADIDQELERRDAMEESQFEQNLSDTFLLRSWRWERLDFLEDGEYRFATRVNVLLGKNGYGKTLLLRTLAALIQRDRDVLRHLAGSLKPVLRLEIAREDNGEEVKAERAHFHDDVGKIPLLAIPDSRFVNRSVQLVAGSITGGEPLSLGGARHFLTQQPYENVIQELLTQLVLDYLSDPENGLNQPIFQLLESVLKELTEDEEFAFDSIERKGRTSYAILTRSAANRTPLPIQTASQGTLSVLAIFGLIYSFLHSLRPDAEEVLTIPGIVMIDEVDAHLHPSWQQKIMALLTGRFPNVQFIVSAHSPLIVAGCDWGEVSVLQRSEEGGFRIKRMTEDFLGATARDLYRKVFEIEEVDRLYLEYSAKPPLPSDDEKTLERLGKLEKRSEEDEARLLELERERRLIDRAAEARERRRNSEDAEIEIAQLKAEIIRLKARIADLPFTVEGPANVKS